MGRRRSRKKQGQLDAIFDEIERTGKLKRPPDLDAAAERIAARREELTKNPLTPEQVKEWAARLGRDLAQFKD